MALGTRATGNAISPLITGQAEELASASKAGHETRNLASLWPVGAIWLVQLSERSTLVRISPRFLMQKFWRSGSEGNETRRSEQISIILGNLMHARCSRSTKQFGAQNGRCCLRSLPI